MPPTKMPRRRHKLKTARIAIYDRHAELTMLGFEIEDLEDLKAEVAMQWDRQDRVWLIHRLDIKNAMEALDDLGFIVRVRDERD